MAIYFSTENWLLLLIELFRFCQQGIWHNSHKLLGKINAELLMFCVERIKFGIEIPSILTDIPNLLFLTALSLT